MIVIVIIIIIIHQVSVFWFSIIRIIITIIIIIHQVFYDNNRTPLQPKNLRDFY